ncbi:hypothetical protein K432DRAFT_389790 [Lepidopterella palustris CBS 459.81]|uniref:Uncharacterized protein n=1 Tax=Lepidopterella palustris CBS 459.81 TaxID=1314670 RepID=A0A8E2EHJ3_9PEZI|nr:hypothetical protein K432DRAFT_389790 [Lepidopterella palustris CBS 459.81]
MAFGESERLRTSFRSSASLQNATTVIEMQPLLVRTYLLRWGQRGQCRLVKHKALPRRGRRSYFEYILRILSAELSLPLDSVLGIEIMGGSAHSGLLVKERQQTRYDDKQYGSEEVLGFPAQGRSKFYHIGKFEDWGEFTKQEPGRNLQQISPSAFLSSYVYRMVSMAAAA